ncbi:MAG: UDP-N-acetylmuramate dehydrogenase [Pseudomonadota bacterium]
MMRRLTETQKKWLAERFKNQVWFNAPLASRTSFHIGGPAEALVTPENRDELFALVTGARDRGLGYQVFGGGTNLLVTDQGISGLVIRIARCLDTIEAAEEPPDGFRVRVGAGVTLRRFCRYCLSHGLKGMNFAIGIPGTVGGALTMNAGTGAGSMTDGLCSLMLLMGSGGVRGVERDLILSGHRSLTWRLAGEEADASHPAVILGGEFLLARGEAAELKAEARGIMIARKMSQPIGFPSAGCIFKNPPDGAPAGRLIDMAGLKGRRQGGAVISERHANYIVNTGGATAADVLSLMNLVKETVWNRFQIQLEPEVKVVGD